MSINFSALNLAAVSAQPLSLHPGTPRENLNDLFNPGAAVSLNPQPLPPRVASSAWLRPGSTVSLNPQPLPPGEMIQNSYLNPGVLIEFHHPLPDPPPDATNLWTHSAVFTSPVLNSLQWFQGAGAISGR